MVSYSPYLHFLEALLGARRPSIGALYLRAVKVSPPRQARLQSRPNFTSAMHPGDSGSIVIDAVTSCVYGHVVASNPLGEVYVSPLSATMEQIKKLLPAIRVGLPD